MNWSLRDLEQAALALSSGLVVVAVGWCVLLLLIPESFGVWLLGSAWGAVVPLLVPLGVTFAGLLAMIGPMTVLRAVANSRRSLRANVLTSIVTLTLIIEGAWSAGALGACWGAALAAAIGTLAWWRQAVLGDPRSPAGRRRASQAVRSCGGSAGTRGKMADDRAAVDDDPARSDAAHRSLCIQRRPGRWFRARRRLDVGADAHRVRGGLGRHAPDGCGPSRLRASSRNRLRSTPGCTSSRSPTPDWLLRIPVLRDPGRFHRLKYVAWQFAALRVARRLHRRRSFDVAWHVTWANAWLGSTAALLGVPFVFGPVGGGVEPPWRLARFLGLRGLFSEIQRTTVRWLARRINPLALISWRRAALDPRPEPRDDALAATALPATSTSCSRMPSSKKPPCLGRIDHRADGPLSTPAASSPSRACHSHSRRSPCCRHGAW